MGEDYERCAGGAPRMFAGLDLTLYGELDLSSEVYMYICVCHDVVWHSNYNRIL